MLSLLFPRKCTFCQGLLSKNETDFCHNCRSTMEHFKKSKRNIPFVAHWTALWYYKENVRSSIHRYKFGGRRSYAQAYARMMAMKLSDSIPSDIDLICWVPVFWLRRYKRGFDQSELIARAIGKEISVPAMPVLKKIRSNPAQSTLQGVSQRKANVTGVYRVRSAPAISGRRILLIDDVITTGATASECARILLTAGAKEVYLAAIAASSQDK